MAAFDQKSRVQPTCYFRAPCLPTVSRGLLLRSVFCHDDGLQNQNQCATMCDTRGAGLRSKDEILLPAVAKLYTILYTDWRWKWLPKPTRIDSLLSIKEEADGERTTVLSADQEEISVSYFQV